MPNHIFPSRSRNSLQFCYLPFHPAYRQPLDQRKVRIPVVFSGLLLAAFASYAIHPMPCGFYCCLGVSQMSCCLKVLPRSFIVFIDTLKVSCDLKGCQTHPFRKQFPNSKIARVSSPFRLPPFVSPAASASSSALAAFSAAALRYTTALDMLASQPQPCLALVPSFLRSTLMRGRRGVGLALDYRY